MYVNKSEEGGGRLEEQLKLFWVLFYFFLVADISLSEALEQKEILSIHWCNFRFTLLLAFMTHFLL